MFRVHRFSQRSYCTGLIISFCLLGSITLVMAAEGDGGGNETSYGSSSESRADNRALRMAKTALKEKEFPKAISILNDALENSPDNADMLNLLGFSHRKMQDYEKALMFYQQALVIDPQHRGANNYLGHLYLETDQLKMAKERLEVLNQACLFGCDEYDDLQAAIEKQGIYR